MYGFMIVLSILVENEVEAAGKTTGSLFVSYIESGFCFYVGGGNVEINTPSFFLDS